MPKMISLRDVRVATLSGDVVLFKANVARDVPQSVVADAMQLGCVPTNTADIPFYEDMEKAKVEFQGDARRSTIYLAIKSIIERNNIKEFDAGGIPKVDVVTARLGYTVSRDEVRAIFELYNTAKGEGREYGLHPQAQNIMRVIEADSKVELVELATEFGIEEEKAKSMVGRELRKLLLTKFNGVAVS